MTTYNLKEITKDSLDLISSTLVDFEDKKIEITDFYKKLSKIDNEIYNGVSVLFNLFKFYKKDGTQWTEEEITKIFENNNSFIY